VPEQPAVPPARGVAPRHGFVGAGLSARKRPPRPMPGCVATLTASWSWS